MAPASELTPFPARYHHVPVMSECDSACTLCATLGCLRPAKITSPEFQRELDLAQRNLKTAVVFPPNFLHHPEAAQFVSDAVARGLRAVVRLRPEQLLPLGELISTLSYRDAEFEMIVSEPIPSKVLNRRRASAGPSFKTVFIPTRAYDPTLLLESMPLSWRRSVEVLAPLSQEWQTSALTPDEVFLFLSSVANDRRIRPYAEFDRRPQGLIPGAAACGDPRRFSFRALGANDESLRLTLGFVISSSDTTVLERQLVALKSQTYARQKFEIVFAFERVSDEVIEHFKVWAGESGLTIHGLELSACWGDPAPRKSQALNLVASYARGSMLLFLDETVPAIDLLSQVARDLEAQKRVTIPNSKTSSLSVAMSLEHYFDCGGFSEAIQHPGFEIDSLVWKSRQLVADRALTATSREQSRKQRLSAQEFYLCTLSPDVFRANFALMGPAFQARRLFRFLTHHKAARSARVVLTVLRSLFAKERLPARVIA